MKNSPNIILIVTDQQRFDTIHAGGNPHIYTPHLDWLAEGGTQFRRCYADSPVSVSSRASLLTGRHFHNMRDGGWWGQPTVTNSSATLPALLTRHGYQTRAIGKLHYHPARAHYGFEHTEILQDYYRHMARHPELGVPMDHGLGQNEMEPAISTVSETNSLTRWITGRAANFLETRDPTRPFFLQVGYSKPHPPLDPCLSYWQLYDGVTLPEPVFGEWSLDPERIPAGFLQSTRSLNGLDRWPRERVMAARRAYYALITQIDYNLGALFARLRELDLQGETWIFFTSDHGEMLGDHHMGAKSVYLEGSAHVPLLARPPQGPEWAGWRAAQCEDMVCLADLAPTILDLAGVSGPQPGSMDGQSLVALRRGAPGREILHGSCGIQHGVIGRRFKFCFAEMGAGELFFDLENDPMEQNNLAGTRRHQAEYRRLKGLLIERFTAAGHPCAHQGRLVESAAARSRQEERSQGWPGLHSTLEPNDVLH